MGRQIGSALEMKQIASATNPASGANLLYFKSDGLLYRKDATGTEAAVGSTGASVTSIAPVKVASTATLTQSGTQTIDAIACAAGDRVLCKDQTSAAQNGVWVVAAGAWTRATDASTSALLAAASVGVASGTVNGGSIYRNAFRSTDTLDTTAMPWAEDYSDLNPPFTLQRSYFATASLPTPPASESVESTPDGKSLYMKAADGTTTLIGPGAPTKLVSRRTTSITTTSLTVVTSGLQVTLVAGKTYYFRARGHYQSTVTTAGPVLAMGAMGGTLAVSSIRHSFNIWKSVSTQTLGNASALTTSLISATTGNNNADQLWEIEGLVVVTTGGLFGINFAASSAATITLQPNCFLICDEVP